ncbi:tRNA (adenosine(37)-N6)-threonylcarbamoyltransferase complex dimerization subunit type 1 TsaB [Robiginitalea sp. M366]|uniref:tRNA (adenosine(37)-N6)-threonylcarbamoyltransferase complex dimerization subunit type 1 TsaB n=1 Tax=Robiginitalea aestuariiviva TaxID=3036903 RepID=UPI00240E98F9|nr:tRNA (adenosine(37)-N6)-threonylcarbamoyltransferase complex dimerization subunit type 1 TsaB [Robiginitalea aestuariiviva]MDG1570989.1 tRNA (adenosine(37)-N6)-threonylcarbamoyltransferase complex dimerization subunit type 1 TsaB [Robiginitalea aestuariiviva]
MACILNIETASTNCSVALFQGEALIALREDRTDAYTHGEELHSFIAAVLAEAGLGPEGLDAVAVGKGPGSYTGLRIGVSAAKGLCFAQDIPLIALSTLEIMARGLEVKEGILVPMLDARRMEVYSAIFNADGQPLRETRAEVLSADSFAQYRDQPAIHLLGSGAAKTAEVLPDPVFVRHPDILPDARFMGPMAYERFRAGAFEDVAYFEPFYLKDFIPGVRKN